MRRTWHRPYLFVDHIVYFPNKTNGTSVLPRRFILGSRQKEHTGSIWKECRTSVNRNEITQRYRIRSSGQGVTANVDRQNLEPGDKQNKLILRTPSPVNFFLQISRCVWTFSPTSFRRGCIWRFSQASSHRRVLRCVWTFSPGVFASSKLTGDWRKIYFFENSVPGWMTLGNDRIWSFVLGTITRICLVINGRGRQTRPRSFLFEFCHEPLPCVDLWNGGLVLVDLPCATSSCNRER
jgi:hypothetical protein